MVKGKVPDLVGLGRLFAETRLGLGLTPTDITNKSKVSRTTIREIEEGRNANPKTETIVRIARALSIEPNVALSYVGRTVKDSGPAGASHSPGRVSLERVLYHDEDLDDRDRAAILAMYDYITRADQ